MCRYMCTAAAVVRSHQVLTQHTEVRSWEYELALYLNAAFSSHLYSCSCAQLPVKLSTLCGDENGLELISLVCIQQCLRPDTQRSQIFCCYIRLQHHQQILQPCRIPDIMQPVLRRPQQCLQASSDTRSDIKFEIYSSLALQHIHPSCSGIGHCLQLCESCSAISWHWPHGRAPAAEAKLHRSRAALDHLQGSQAD